MKNIHLFFLMLFCHLSQAQIFHLTVLNGYGSGNYKAGTRIHIYSESNPNNNVVFNEWTTNIPIQMDQIDEWHTIITMPNKDVIVNATYSQINGYNPTLTNFGFNRIVIPGDTVIVNIGPQFTTYGTMNYGYDTTLTPAGATIGLQTTILEDRELFYYFPNNMKGIVEFYHWTNGSADGWLNSSERFESVKHLLNANFGVLIPQSEERMRHKKNPLNYDLNNDDVVRFTVEYRNIRNERLTIAQLQQYVREQYDIYMMHKVHVKLKEFGYTNDQTNFFSLGFSAGASFAEQIAHKFKYKATACIGNSGLENLIKDPIYNYETPTIFSYGEKDNFDSTLNKFLIKDWITDYCNVLTNKGVDNEQYSFSTSPIHPYRFTQVKGINSTESNQLYNDFVSKGVTYTDSLSGQVYFKFSPTVLSRNKLQIPKWNDLENNSPEISATLENVIYQIGAGHCSRSDFDKKIIKFFLKHNDTTATTNLNPVTKIHEFKLYPNPNNGKFNLSSDTYLGHVEIHDFTGKKVYDAFINEPNTEIELTYPGLYIIKINQVYLDKVLVLD